MAAKINRKITIDGKSYSIHANSEQEYAEKLIEKLGATVTVGSLIENKHNFEQYARDWFETHSPTIAKATAVNYERQLNSRLIPALGSKAVEDITTDDIQRLFNSMEGTKATKEKPRIVLNMIFNSAYEDGIIDRNPMKSSRLKITGKASQETTPYTVEQIRFLVGRLEKVQEPGGACGNGRGYHRPDKAVKNRREQYLYSGTAGNRKSVERSTRLYYFRHGGVCIRHAAVSACGGGKHRRRGLCHFAYYEWGNRICFRGDGPAKSA